MEEEISIKASIASDHAGYELKEEIIKFLSENGIPTIDYGCESTESVDYPDYAHAVIKSMYDQESDFGILICGSGNGMSMASNKWPGVRAALAWNEEVAKLSRLHNDSNVLILPARFISIEDALSCLKAFLSTEFEGGRHSNRISKIDIEKSYMPGFESEKD